MVRRLMVPSLLQAGVVLIHEAPSLKPQTETAYKRRLPPFPTMQARARWHRNRREGSRRCALKTYRRYPDHRALPASHHAGCVCSDDNPARMGGRAAQPWFLKSAASSGQDRRRRSRATSGQKITTRSNSSAPQRAPHGLPSRPRCAILGNLAPRHSYRRLPLVRPGTRPRDNTQCTVLRHCRGCYQRCRDSCARGQISLSVLAAHYSDSQRRSR